MINFIKQKNDMKKLAYIVITSSMFLTTSCVDLTQEPQSFITEEEYIARMDLTSLQQATTCLLYTSPSPRDRQKSRMPSSA